MLIGVQAVCICKEGCASLKYKGLFGSKNTSMSLVVNYLTLAASIGLQISHKAENKTISVDFIWMLLFLQNLSFKKKVERDHQNQTSVGLQFYDQRNIKMSL